MARFSWIQNTIGQLRTVTILYTFAFVITRYSCHRCVYIMIVVIFAVVACTITFFIKTYLLSPFLIIFWCLGTFCDHVIFRSTYKAFPRRTLRIPVRWNINRAIFILFLSNPFETCFCRIIITSTKCELCLNIVCSLIMSTRPWATAVKIQVIILQGWDVQNILVSKLFLSSQFCLMAWYLSWLIERH